MLALQCTAAEISLERSPGQGMEVCWLAGRLVLVLKPDWFECCVVMRGGEAGQWQLLSDRSAAQ